MNVYLWGGKDRESATKWLVKNNQKAKVMYNYTYDAAEGIMMVAYPDKDKVGVFEFNYWVAPFHESWVVRLYEWNFEGDYGQKVLLIFVLVIVAIVILLIATYCICVKIVLKDSRVAAYELGDINTTKGPESTNTYAGELETVEDEMDDENLQYQEKEKEKKSKKKKDKKYKKEDPDASGDEETQKEKDRKSKKDKKKKKKK